MQRDWSSPGRESESIGMSGFSATSHQTMLTQLLPEQAAAGPLLLAGGLAFLVSLVLGPVVIRGLKARFQERIASDSVKLNELHAAKQHTPTMGGLLILISFLAGSSIAVSWTSLWTWLVFVISVLLCGVGATDDWIKLRTTRKGLTVRQKLVAQIVIATVASIGLFCVLPQTGYSRFSLSGWLPESLYFLMIPWSVFIIVATSNAVNLTDGLDGLAAGCTAICGLAMTLLIAWQVHEIQEITRTEFSKRATDESVAAVQWDSALFMISLSGAALGFLWFNRHPARVFMGDAGSLPIGGLLGLLALGSRMELLLLLTGVVFVAETVSVMIQVTWYRRTGRRILLCSPLHNHFVFLRIPERRIVTGFWILSLFGVLLAFLAFHTLNPLP